MPEINEIFNSMPDLIFHYVTKFVSSNFILEFILQTVINNCIFLRGGEGGRYFEFSYVGGG